MPGVTVFKNQQQIDAFPSDYPGCIEIEGNIWILEDSAGAITNLDSFYPIQRINGYLQIIENAALVNLKGLDNLSHIGSFSNINKNQNLTSLLGLNNLDSVEGGFEIASNSSLNDLNDLHSLSCVGELFRVDDNDQLSSLGNIGNASFNHIEILRNDALENLNALSSLSFVSGKILIISNNSLCDMNGLSSLSSTGGSFVISENPILADLEGLSNLSSVKGNLQIRKNNNLKSISNLENLSLISGSIVVENNAVLNSLHGIHNIDPLSIKSISNLHDIEIQNNPMLSTCAVESICEVLILPWISTDIYNNAPGCDTVSEILSACISSTTDVKQKEKEIVLFPNPAQDEIAIIAEVDAEVRIFNSTGQSVGSINIRRGRHAMDISWLDTGLYFFKCNNNIVHKIVKY